MKKVPFLLKMIQGAIGKRYVVKHYRYGVVVTRYPDMSGVRASEGQRKCRDLFKEAVAFAKEVFADEARKAAYERKLGRRKRLFQAVMKLYMEAKRLKEEKEKKEDEIVAKRGKKMKEIKRATRDGERQLFKVWPHLGVWRCAAKRNDPSGRLALLRPIRYGPASGDPGQRSFRVELYVQQGHPKPAGQAEVALKRSVFHVSGLT